MSRVGEYVRAWAADYAVSDVATFNAKLNRLSVFTAIGRAGREIQLEGAGRSWELVRYVEPDDRTSGIVLARPALAQCTKRRSRRAAVAPAPPAQGSR